MSHHVKAGPMPMGSLAGWWLPLKLSVPPQTFGLGFLLGIGYLCGATPWAHSDFPFFPPEDLGMSVHLSPTIPAWDSWGSQLLRSALGFLSLGQ